MKKLIIALTIAFAAPSAFASCFGTDGFKTCTDQSGNTYNVQKFGNSTHVTGHNPNGSTWNQNSTTFGNTTYHNGTAANGNSWSGTSQTFGGTTYNNGINSNGKPYSSTCTEFGCN